MSDDNCDQYRPRPRRGRRWLGYGPLARRCTGTSRSGRRCKNTIKLLGYAGERRWAEARCGGCTGPSCGSPLALIVQAAHKLRNNVPAGAVISQFGLAVATHAVFDLLETAAWDDARRRHWTFGAPVGADALVTSEDVQILLSVAPPGGGATAQESHLRLLEDFVVGFEGVETGLGRLVSRTLSPAVLHAAVDITISVVREIDAVGLAEAISVRAAELVMLFSDTNPDLADAAENLLKVMAKQHCGSSVVVSSAVNGCRDAVAAAEAVLEGCCEPYPCDSPTSVCPQPGLSPQVALILLGMGTRCPQAALEAAAWHPVTANAAQRHPLATPAVRSAAAAAISGLGHRTVLKRAVACGRLKNPRTRCGRRTSTVIDRDWCGRCSGLPDTHRRGWTPRSLPSGYVPLAADGAGHEGLRLSVVRAGYVNDGTAGRVWAAKLAASTAGPSAGGAAVIGDSRRFCAALKRVASFADRRQTTPASGVVVADYGDGCVLAAGTPNMMVLDYTSSAVAAPRPAVISSYAAAEILSGRVTLKAIHIDSDRGMFYDFAAGRPWTDPLISSLELSENIDTIRVPRLGDVVAAAATCTPIDLPTSETVSHRAGAVSVFSTTDLACLLETPKPQDLNLRQRLIEIDPCGSEPSATIVDLPAHDGPQRVASTVGRRTGPNCGHSSDTAGTATYFRSTHIAKIVAATTLAGTDELLVGLSETPEASRPAVFVICAGCVAVLAPTLRRH